MIGIYAIYRKSDDACVYVGQSKEIEKRILMHIKYRCGRFKNITDELYYKALETFDYYDKENQLNREAYWINELNPELNIIRDRHLSVEMKGHLRETNIEKHHSEETKQKISKTMTGKNHPFYGKHHSEEVKQKISNTMKGEKRSAETLRKFRESRKWYRHSEETRHKISESNKGKTWSEERRLKMNEIMKSEEYRQKMSNSCKGKSDETRKRIGNAKKGKHWKIINNKRVWY